MDITLSVDETKLADHVRRVCKRNLQKPCECCKKCPFLATVLAIMDWNQWGYNTEIEDFV